jgi:hypothetical protein
MSTFTPEGTLLVSFDNGTVRMWRTALRRETIQRLGGKTCHDLAAISYVQFNLDDELDMIKQSRMTYDPVPGMEDESDFGELAAYSVSTSCFFLLFSRAKNIPKLKQSTHLEAITTSTMLTVVPFNSFSFAATEKKRHVRRLASDFSPLACDLTVLAQ